MVVVVVEEDDAPGLLDNDDDEDDAVVVVAVGRLDDDATDVEAIRLDEEGFDEEDAVRRKRSNRITQSNRNNR